MIARGFDIIGAGIGLLVLSPIFFGIAMAVKRHDGGPVLYRARRVGRHGREFDLYKFRTMVVNADRQGAAITASGDDRITPVGKFLRRAKLDELPQLLNVFRGEMSLVGPRPEDPRYVELYTPAQREILTVRPGITSAASLVYRNEEQLLSGDDWEVKYRQEVMPAKLAIDLSYIRNRSLWSDIGLIIRTILAVGKD